jgi:alpha-N-arabinofuranosidase
MRPSTLEAALAEAAFMTGFERNADVVTMSAYAPLLAHADGWQWTPNLIWFDNLRSFGTPSYYAQQLFGANRGGALLPVMTGGKPRNGDDGLYTSASTGTSPGSVIVKLVNTTAAPRVVRFEWPASARLGAGSISVLAGRPGDENTFADPRRVAPRVWADAVDPAAPWTLPPHSISVIRFQGR